MILHRTLEDLEDSPIQIQPFDIVLFITENAAITVVHQCLLCINKLWNEVNTIVSKKSERLFIDTTASLLTLCGSIFTVSAETKDILAQNIHELNFMLQSRGDAVPIASDDMYESSHMLPLKLRDRYTHQSYFHSLIHTHHSIEYELGAFYQEIHDELGVFGNAEFIRQQSLAKKVSQGYQTSWKAFLEHTMTNVYILLMK